MRGPATRPSYHFTIHSDDTTMAAAEDGADDYLDAPEDIGDDVELAVERLTLKSSKQKSESWSSSGDMLIDEASNVAEEDADLSPSEEGRKTFDHFDPKAYSPEELAKWRKKQAADLQLEIRAAYTAIDLFLDSKILEAESFLAGRVSGSLYFALALAAIHSLRALITFEDIDIVQARSSLKNVLSMASVLRQPNTRKTTSVISSVINTVASVIKPGMQLDLKSMTPLQRHAELIHAEVYLMRAVLSIVTDGNILSFVREGLHIRESYGTYAAFWNHIQKAAKGQPAGKKLDAKDIGLDNDFLVGVLFGIGVFNLILSMLPPKVVKLFEIVGYAADQDTGLACLETACGYEVKLRWSTKNLTNPPTNCAAFTFPIAPRPDGLRQFLGKMLLGLFHSVFPTLVPLTNADLSFGRQILAAESVKYPRSIPFAQMMARIDLTLASPTTAIPAFRKIMTLQQDWKSLHHLAMWEIILGSASLRDYNVCHEFLSTLLVESRWSKAVYHYGLGVTLFALDRLDEAAEHFAKVGGAKQKIAGRSIPLEKFLARKARRFQSQNRYLCLPDLEFFFFFNVLEMMPAQDLDRAKEATNAELERLRNLCPEGVGNVMTTSGGGSKITVPFPTFYDDLALTLFLSAAIDACSDSPGAARRIVQVSPSSIRASPVKPPTPIGNAIATFTQTIPGFGELISLEHWIVPWSRYLAATCLELCGEYTKALEQLQLATVGGYSAEEAKQKKWRVGQYTGGGRKFSMEQPLQTRGWNLKRKLELELALQESLAARR